MSHIQQNAIFLVQLESNVRGNRTSFQLQ